MRPKGVKMVRITRVIITLFVTVIGLSGYVEAADWLVNDIYGDAPHLIRPINPLNLTLKKEYYGIEYKEREKTLGSDSDEFIKETLLTYAVIWAGRTYFVPQNTEQLYNIPKWLRNISGWQGCRGSLARKDLCSPARTSFFKPALWDGDALHTNLERHPLGGAVTYLYYRALGYDRATSSFASFLQSTLFEYTIEGWQQSPSFTDMFATPGLGVPLGMVMELISNRLAESDSQVLRALSYVVDPAKAVLPDGKVAWMNFQAMAVAIQFNW